MFNHIFTSMDRHREVINIFINALGLIGIIIAILSYNADIKKRHEDNEIIRKQTTLKNILDALNDTEMGLGLYCASLLSDMSLDKSDEHNPDELDNIFHFQELVIGDAHKDKLERCFAGETEEKKKAFIKKGKVTKLTIQGSYYVFHRATHDLNLLEALALAYYAGIVDKSIMDSFLGDIYMRPPIQSFIVKLNSAGLTNYEYIEKYIIQLKDNPPKKLPLVDKK